MTATVHEVARNASEAATAAEQARNSAGMGRQVVADTVSAIATLASEVEKAAGAIARLGADSQEIGMVVNVIRDIAEQTNLLALNAAIEAARAGDHGRGFAVVADEVRKLAVNTRNSTRDIQGMVERLRAGARGATAVMEQGRLKAQQSVKQAETAGAALEDIARTVARITDMNVQIASAVEEQAAVAEEINRNVSNITAATEQISEQARATAGASESLLKMSLDLRNRVGRFVA